MNVLEALDSFFRFSKKDVQGSYSDLSWGVAETIYDTLLTYSPEVHEVRKTDRGPLLPPNHVLVMNKVAELAVEMFEQEIVSKQNGQELLFEAMKNRAPYRVKKQLTSPEVLDVEEIHRLLKELQKITEKHLEQDAKVDDEILTILQKAGGKLWEVADKRRVYFNYLHKYYGLELEFYNTGNIAKATLDGEPISNSSARRIVSRLSNAKLWYDLVTNSWGAKGLDRKDAEKIINHGIRERAGLSESEWKRLGLWFEG